MLTQAFGGEAGRVAALPPLLLGLIGGAFLGWRLGAVDDLRIWHTAGWGLVATIVAVVPSLALSVGGELPFDMVLGDHVSVIAVPLAAPLMFLAGPLAAVTRKFAR